MFRRISWILSLFFMLFSLKQTYGVQFNELPLDTLSGVYNKLEKEDRPKFPITCRSTREATHAQSKSVALQLFCDHLTSDTASTFFPADEVDALFLEDTKPFVGLNLSGIAKALKHLVKKEDTPPIFMPRDFAEALSARSTFQSTDFLSVLRTIRKDLPFSFEAGIEHVFGRYAIFSSEASLQQFKQQLSPMLDSLIQTVQRTYVGLDEAEENSEADLLVISQRQLATRKSEITNFINTKAEASPTPCSYKYHLVLNIECDPSNQQKGSAFPLNLENLPNVETLSVINLDHQVTRLDSTFFELNKIAKKIREFEYTSFVAMRHAMRLLYKTNLVKIIQDDRFMRENNRPRLLVPRVRFYSMGVALAYLDYENDNLFKYIKDAHI